MPSPFLTAEWRWLAMLNYEIDPEVLKPFVPAGTELDSREGKTHVSVVGFHFRYARLRGVEIPFHTHFEEVNLRFYVRRTVGNETRRGVVFIKELVPRRAIAWTARWFYNENYVAVPMSHRIHKYGLERRAIYEWSFGGEPHHLETRAECEPFLPPDDSFEAFITEHYWGYARQRDGGTLEYQVEHPRWRVWTALEAELHCDPAALYGKTFAPFLTVAPASAFLADGSAVSVYPGVRI
ncbi:MAG TPA: DUF2071 domain-containing protein [Candidatus Methylacidiphilales bacterium]|jgi:hypothetical protein|nr:DUF2071 domain-containing protein [Candidatus Methylacidiphilales bacterium]